MQSNNKLSIIVPVYNTEKYLKRCLDRLLEQSYKNIEVIIVNDCSTGNCEQIVNEYKLKDNRIKYIKHKVNKGLFQARLTGSNIATGEYIAFLDSDDHVSIDYYRTLMKNIQENNSDIVMGNIVFEYFDGGKCINNYFMAKLHMQLIGESCIEEYFRQEGLSRDWYILWNKIYKKELWDKAKKHFENVTQNITTGGEIIFSTVLFSYAQKFTTSENDNIFHYMPKKVTENNEKVKIQKKLQDIKVVFNFVEQFLKDVNLYNKFNIKLEKWKFLYCNKIRNELETSKLPTEDITAIKKEIKVFCPNEKKIENSDYMESVVTAWNDNLEKIKLQICSETTKCVSFDIFDTLVVRPFFFPTDIFTFLNRDYREITNSKTGMKFEIIRTSSEQMTREKMKKSNPKYQDITLDEIYETIHEEYGINEQVLEQLKKKEYEYELKYCSRRNTGYELYELALTMGKTVICISDMYLFKQQIEGILNKNGYTDLDKVYVSSEYRITKCKGDLFKFVLEERKLEPEEMIHIGDNYISDYQTPKEKYEINAMSLPRAIDVCMDKYRVNNLMDMLTKRMPFWRDNTAGMNFIGIRAMMAVVANKYFDNPYKSFNMASDFNADPYLVGYFTLGWYVFGITKWLLEETNNKGYDKLLFMARDGYLPIKVYSLLKNLYENVPEEEYFYVSRKSLIPVTILDELDFYKLPEVLNLRTNTPKDVLRYIKDAITIKDEKSFYEICDKNGIEPDEEIKTVKKFNNFINVVIENFYDREKHIKSLTRLKNYLSGIFGNNPATFDIGYSGRPELFLSNLYGKPIDTYFCNINHEEALQHAEIAGFKLYTFFDAKPPVIGYIYETMISALAPSCIGYNTTTENVTPVFEKYNKNYQEEFVVGTMQQAAIEFVEDIVNIFGEDIRKLYYQNYYISLPIMAYMNSAKDLDRDLFKAITFENDLVTKEQGNMASELKKELKFANQVSIEELIDLEDGGGTIQLQLKNISKPMRLIFYMLYDRKTFRIKMNEIFGKHKIIYRVLDKIHPNE